MPNEVDKSLLDRLQALRGSSATPERLGPAKIEIDVIERQKTPTREDTLAARLKSLRSQDEISPHPPSPPVRKSVEAHVSQDISRNEDLGEDDVDAAFQTDDQTLEELLGDVGADETFTTEPDDDAKVKALLEELSASIPQDSESANSKKEAQEKAADSDDSDGENMQHEVDDVIARFRDEIQIEAALAKDEPGTPSESHKDPGNDTDDQQPPPDLALPSVPTDITASEPNSNPHTSPPASSSSSLDDITARLSALRASSSSPSLDLPSVPISRPAKAPKRLESRTNYTDDDVDSWCTVCLADATLLCLGCGDLDEGKEGDPYCTRCWREMHVGPAAAFDDRTHRAVQLRRSRKKDKVALAA